MFAMKRLICAKNIRQISTKYLHSRLWYAIVIKYNWVSYNHNQQHNADYVAKDKELGKWLSLNAKCAAVI